MSKTFDEYMDGHPVNVTNTAATPVHAPIDDMNAFQVYIRPSSTEQVYTVDTIGGGSIEVHEGAFFNFKTKRPVPKGTLLFYVTTATSAAVLQVVGFNE